MMASHEVEMALSFLNDSFLGPRATAKLIPPEERWFGQLKYCFKYQLCRSPWTSRDLFI